jgi:serine/threonine protein kinase
MGRVWQARDELLGRDIAIKEVRLPPGLSEAEKDNLRQRMLREARSAARLSHPAVTTVYDVIEDLGRPWIVMELIHGRSLDRVIAKYGPLSPKAVAQIGRQLLAALAAAHAVGVLHRDVKPSNVLLTSDGRAVLTDFGVATIDGDPSLTQTGTVVGTPAFSAPERIRGEVATPTADLWSLGATLYAAAEGQGPYDHHRGATATIAAIVTDDPQPPTTAGPLAGAISAFLSRDPAARPSAAAAMRMLEKAADAPAETPRHRNPRGRRTPRRSRRAAAVALACLTVALPISIWALQHTAGRTRAPHTSQSRLNSSVPPQSSVDLALHRPVAATSYFQVYQSANVTDGNTSTYWEGAHSVFPQSVTVDLGSVTDIAKIVLALPPFADWNSRVQTLAIHGRRTSATPAFTIVRTARYTFNAATNDDEVTISFAPTATRYVAVYFTANSGWPAAQLAEILIYP